MKKLLDAKNWVKRYDEHLLAHEYCSLKEALNHDIVSTQEDFIFFVGDRSNTEITKKDENYLIKILMNTKN